MNKNILNYIEECEAWKVGIKNLHWSADNLSQHELCDDIASEISDFEDLVSEVEQSISGKIKLNGFTPKSYKITSLKSFVEDVISASQDFLKKLDGMGEKYVGIKSECETFIGTMQRKLYLVNFTLKEELKERIKAKINEGYRKEENIKTIFPGTKPSSDGGILKRLDAISSGKNGQFNSRAFDSMEDAFDFFKRNLEKVGDLVYGGNVDDVTIVSLNAENGKSYNGMIDFVELDNGKYKASIKFSNLGKESEFNEDFEKNENKEVKLSELELKEMVKNSIVNILEAYSYNGIDYRQSLIDQYANMETPKSREKNYKENIKRFRRALRKIAPEYGFEFRNSYAFSVCFKYFLKLIEETEGDDLYTEIWTKYGGEYEELADQFLQKIYLKKKQHDGITESKKKKPIKIAKSKEGTFTAAATKHNMGVQEFANEVLANPEKYSTKMAKKANFARNFGKKK